LSPIWNARVTFSPKCLEHQAPGYPTLFYWRITPKAQKWPMNSSHLFMLETFSGLPSHRDRPFHSWLK
jgi:hypothetical protein